MKANTTAIAQQAKNARISDAILNHIKQGKSVQQAFDAVLGEGSYLKLADELYATLRANGGVA